MMIRNKKICLITGAGSGIGRAIAEALSQAGYQLILAARREDQLNELQSEFVDVLPGDLCATAYQDKLEAHIYHQYGRCDYLFNCAGTLETGSIEEMDIDRMTIMLRLNIEATFRLTYKLLKRFKVQGYGHVINISSVLGTKVRPAAGAYAATKFALEALSEALRMELAGTNLQVSCIEPGLVMTELHRNWKIHPKESMQIHEPLQVSDIVDAVFYILSRPDHVRIPKLMILPKDHHI